MRSKLVLALAAVAAVCAIPQAGAFNPQPDPPGMQALIDDINALPAVQNPQPFLAKALAAREAAMRGQPCVAKNQIDALRNQVNAKSGKKGISDNTWAGIDGDAVRVLVSLLQAPDSAACGGVTVPSNGGTEPTVQVTDSTPTGLTLDVSFPTPWFTTRLGNGVPYLDMGMDGLGSVGDTGSPNIPALTRFFALPVGADAPTVTLLDSSSYVLDGIHLWPQQPQAADPTAVEFGNPPFTINANVYGSNAFYPASPTGTAPVGTLRDFSTGGVESDGAQYNPVSGQLRVFTRVSLHVDFGKVKSDENHIGNGSFGGGYASSLWNRAYKPIYQSTLLNYDVAIANLDNSIRYLFCGEEYLIVTSHALEPAADTLAAARNHDGIRTAVVTVGSGEGDIGTTKEQIKLYISGQLSSNSCLIHPSYVGILGDTAQVPTWHPASPEAGLTGFDGTIASDLPYALSGSDDLLPDLAIGRMPAPNLTVANDEVAKIIGYEDSPPVFGVGDFYGHATVTSFFQCGIDSGGQPCNPGTQDERTFTKLSETVRNGLIASGKTVDRVYTTPAQTPQKFYDGTSLPSALLKSNGFAWNGTGTDVLNDWNAGRFLILHRDHGAPGGWSSPDFSTANIPSLTNGNELPVVFSINCASGKFDDATANFSEQLVEKASGGAVGVIGDSRNSPSNTNSHLAAGLIDAIFPSTLGSYGSSTPIVRMGDVLVAGKQYMNTQNGLDGQASADTTAEEYLYHWFGDPTMPIWTHRPSLFVSGVFSASVLSNLVHLTVSDSSADGSVATLYANGEAIGRAVVQGGVADIVPEGTVPVNTDFQPRLEVVVDNDGFVPTQVPVVTQPVIIGDHLG
jgi:Peptidase family C25/Propeptide_C25